MKEPIDLATAITPEAMIPILANAEVQQRLLPHLPQGSSLPRSEDELRNTISTPQFQQVRRRHRCSERCWCACVAHTMTKVDKL